MRVMGMMTGAAYDSECDFSSLPPTTAVQTRNLAHSPHVLGATPAVTSGGTIPDRGMYTVVLPERTAVLARGG